MKHFEVGCILIVCFLCGITGTLASCKGGTTSSNQCDQTCGGFNECKCNTTGAPTYDTCIQKCMSLTCFSEINITCIAQQNCTQVCESGLCDMTCNAKEYCKQNGDSNGVEAMSCSSKGCKQSCMEGNCKMMHCEADECLQTCDNGGCTMNCTESVKRCSQRCTAKTECILECHAEVCQQECSGPAQCIILNKFNTSPSRVHLNILLLIIAFFMLLLQ